MLEFCKDFRSAGPVEVLRFGNIDSLKQLGTRPVRVFGIFRFLIF